MCIERCHFSEGDGIKFPYDALALKVLDSELLGIDSKEWMEILDNLDAFNLHGDDENEIDSILRSTFDGLKFEDQLLFIDAAIFYPVYMFLGISYARDFKREEGRKYERDINIMKWLNLLYRQPEYHIKERVRNLYMHQFLFLFEFYNNYGCQTCDDLTLTYEIQIFVALLVDLEGVHILVLNLFTFFWFCN